VSNLPPYEPDDTDDVQPPVWRVGRYGYDGDGIEREVRPAMPSAPDPDLYASPTPYGETAFPEPNDAEDEAEVAPRINGGDPTFGFIVAVALSVGLMGLVPNNTDVRYIVVWGVLAFFAITAWLFGHSSRIEREEPENLGWGIAFGALIGIPLLAVGAEPLATTSQLLFRAAIDGEVRPLSSGSVLALLVFVQPLAETLFFRGLAQDHRPFWFVGGIATLWSVLLFFPMLDVGRFPLVGVVIAVALLMMNLVYSYVRRRNGLAAAWLCQIVLNFILLFVPYTAG
jgi:membrane protease YdiL (CAAX protease family)